nr:Uncharacterised protein [Raoultella sp. NCTC 9187]
MSEGLAGRNGGHLLQQRILGYRPLGLLLHSEVNIPFTLGLSRI